MAETYCGKSCAECTQKEQLNCCGCKAGPGRKFGGDCKIAKCVAEKGHEDCHTCSFQETCSTRRKCDNMPEDRRRKLEAEAARRARTAKAAPALGRWLWVIFWLVIPATIAGLMTNETLVRYVPSLLFPGQLINLICLAVYGVALLQLAKIEDRYKKAAVCLFVRCCVALAMIFATGTTNPDQPPSWTLLLTIPAAILALVGEYHEFMGHSTVLAGEDNELSDKWETLWKWNIGLSLGLFGCIVVVLIFPVLGVLAMLGAAIGLLVVGILKLVYLHRTARFFREYPETR